MPRIVRRTIIAALPAIGMAPVGAARAAQTPLLYRVLVVVAGEDTLRAGIDRGRVGSVILRSARFSTADSLRVGISLARLRAYPGMEGAEGEGEYFVYDETDPRTCGLSFRLNLGPRGLGSIPSGLVRSLPAAASKLVVDEILVRGCPK